VVRRTKNGGFGSAVNEGARLASGELLLILNSDLEVSTSFVADLVVASSRWMPAVTSPRIVGHDAREMWTGRRFPKIRHQTTEWLVPLARLRSQGHLDDAVGRDTRARGAVDDVPVDFVVGAAMLLPRSAFEAVGGFDERFFMNSEEADLQRRLRHIGVPSVVLRHPIAVHEGGGSSNPELRRAWLVASRLTYAEKWGHPRILRATLTAASGINFLWNGARQLAGRDVNALATLRTEIGYIWSNPLGHANAARLDD
jgi:N-acetylglucosaminyl-diphospho-decaprenol L-rhamnosyltransferase